MTDLLGPAFVIDRYGREKPVEIRPGGNIVINPGDCVYDANGRLMFQSRLTWWQRAWDWFMR